MNNILTKMKNELSAVEKELKQLPEGRMVKRKSLYSHIINKKSIGITKNKDLIRNLSRKKYLVEYKKQLSNNISHLSKSVEKFDTRTPAAIIESFTQSYQDLPADYFHHSSIKEWLEFPYKKNTHEFASGQFFSDRGVPFRSKSELLIANQLEKYKIPYHYDVEFMIEGQKKYPDFLIKSPYTGRTIIWEHFGALHIPEYANTMNEKMDFYQSKGYVPFDNLIYTFEFDVKNSKRLQYLIENIIIGL